MCRCLFLAKTIQAAQKAQCSCPSPINQLCRSCGHLWGVQVLVTCVLAGTPSAKPGPTIPTWGKQPQSLADSTGACLEAQRGHLLLVEEPPLLQGMLMKMENCSGSFLSPERHACMCMCTHTPFSKLHFCLSLPRFQHPRLLALASSTGTLRPALVLSLSLSPLLSLTLSLTPVPTCNEMLKPD